MARYSTAAAPAVALTDLVRQTDARGNGAFVAALTRLDNGRLHCEAAPGLSAAFGEAIDAIRTGPRAASCGTAAYRGHPIYVPDIGDDALWAGVPDLRDMALDAGFRACWSVPIMSPDRRVLGTFAIYHREPRGPTAVERKLLAEAAQSAAELLAEGVLAAG